MRLLTVQYVFVFTFKEYRLSRIVNVEMLGPEPVGAFLFSHRTTILNSTVSSVKKALYKVEYFVEGSFGIVLRICTVLRQR